MIFPSYLFISYRYLASANQNTTIRTMLRITFASIFIVTFALALIMSIMEGFEIATYTKMQSIYPQLIIDADNQELDYNAIQTLLNHPDNNIAYHAPQQMMQALCNSIEFDIIPTIVCLNGIVPELEKKVTYLEKMILPNNLLHNLTDLCRENQVIIGKALALQMHASVGSQLKIISSPDFDLTQIKKFHENTVIVAGIFSTGIDDFDGTRIYCSTEFFTTLFPDYGIRQIYAQAIPGTNEDDVIKKLTDKLGLHVYSWKQMYSSLVSAMQLEKYALYCILLLIMLIASCNIISLLFMHITQKQRDIALLLTLGLTVRQVKTIFLTSSMTIATIASISGLCMAWITGLFLSHYKWIKLSENVYYVDHLPIIIEPLLFLFIFFVVLTISFFASLIPLSKIKMKYIATILRNEI